MLTAGQSFMKSKFHICWQRIHDLCLDSWSCKQLLTLFRICLIDEEIISVEISIKKNDSSIHFLQPHPQNCCEANLIRLWYVCIYKSCWVVVVGCTPHTSYRSMVPVLLWILLQRVSFLLAFPDSSTFESRVMNG